MTLGAPFEGACKCGTLRVVIAEVNRNSYDADGNTAQYKAALADAVAASQLRAAALPLAWSIDDALSATVAKAAVDSATAIADIDLEVLHFNSFGKGFMKTVGISPDGFIQMALQLAYNRDCKGDHFPLTYESAMTRLFRDGRTETIRRYRLHADSRPCLSFRSNFARCSRRSCCCRVCCCRFCFSRCSVSLSDGSVAFVKAMINPSATNAQRIDLLKKAADGHQVTTVCFVWGHEFWLA